MNSSKNLGYILKMNVMTATLRMSDADFRKTITALFNYATLDRLPEKDDLSELGWSIFWMEQPSIDYHNSKWKKSNE